MCIRDRFSECTSGCAVEPLKWPTERKTERMRMSDSAEESSMDLVEPFRSASAMGSSLSMICVRIIRWSSGVWKRFA
eukprot:1889471-Prymnesium_polylepis.1